MCVEGIKTSNFCLYLNFLKNLFEENKILFYFINPRYFSNKIRLIVGQLKWACERWISMEKHFINHYTLSLSLDDFRLFCFN